MNRETYLKILSIQERAMNDAEYLALHKKYVPAQESFSALLLRLPESERAVVEDFLEHSTSLFYRLMAMAINPDVPF